MEFTLAGDKYNPLTVDPDMLITTADDKVIERNAADNSQTYVTPGESEVWEICYIMLSIKCDYSCFKCILLTS